MRTALKPILQLSSITTNPSRNFKAHVESCVSLLKNFISQGLITEGSALHGHLIKMGTSKDRSVAIKLLIMYLNHPKSPEAAEVLREFNGSDLVACNCRINALVQQGHLEEARKVFDEMPERNEVSWTTLISGFMKYGRVEESMRYFERNPFQNVFSWTAGISGYVQNGFSFEALELFRKLLGSGVRPNAVTLTSVVRACADLGDIRFGESVICLIIKLGFECKLAVSNSLITLCLRIGDISMARRVFDRMEERDVVSWTAILDMYVGLGDLGEARRIFELMPERNEVSWSAMIARYSQSGYPGESIELFRRMVQEGIKPNVSCFLSVLSALASFEALREGMDIHGRVIKSGNERDPFVCSSLIDFYCKCGQTLNGRLVFDLDFEKNVVSWNAMIGGYGMNGQIEEAEELFEIMPLRDNVSWSAMIAGYLESKQFDKVLEVFNEMLSSGIIPNKSTFSSLFCACASTASLEKGKYLHGKITKFGIQHDIYVSTALTDMYAKSGDIESSRRVFDRMPEKNEISWTAMIQGLAESGFAEESLNLFEEMEQTSTPPNEFVLLSVLFACSHSGLVDKGLRYFNSMETVYGVKPRGRHYTCVADMLSRAGRLSEAEAFINSMPIRPEVNTWAALLSGCKTYKNEEVAERIIRKLREMAEENSAGYVLLSNIYALGGKWVDVSAVRKLMKEKGLKKSGGCSWIEVRNEVHSFYSEDGKHSRLPEIYGMLELLKLRG